MTYHIFVGYDERQHEPFLVAKHSLESLAKVPIKVHKMHHKDYRLQKLFTRKWTVEENGQYTDVLDGKPFSTQFSHSRFLVPELWRRIKDEDKNPLVMFVDCDFVWTSDIGIMFKELEMKKIRNKSTTPVYCVHHNYKPTTLVKMDTVEQTSYNKKLWSSMMVFDMDHEDNSKLTKDCVNVESGNWLHSFNWVENPNSLGIIDESWNFIPDHSEKNTSVINAIHYTEGGPWFKEYRQCSYGNLWWNTYEKYLSTKIKRVSFDVEGMIDG